MLFYMATSMSEGYSIRSEGVESSPVPPSQDVESEFSVEFDFLRELDVENRKAIGIPGDIPDDVAALLEQAYTEAAERRVAFFDKRVLKIRQELFSEEERPVDKLHDSLAAASYLLTFSREENSIAFGRVAETIYENLEDSEGSAVLLTTRRNSACYVGTRSAGIDVPANLLLLSLQCAETSYVEEADRSVTTYSSDFLPGIELVRVDEGLDEDLIARSVNVSQE